MPCPMTRIRQYAKNSLVKAGLLFTIVVHMLSTLHVYLHAPCTWLPAIASKNLNIWRPGSQPSDGQSLTQATERVTGGTRKLTKKSCPLATCGNT